MNKRSFANHVRWCKSNPKYEQMLKSTKEKIKKSLNDYNNKIRGELKDFNVICYNCGKEFIVNEYENKFPSKEKYYCSLECAHAHNKFVENIGNKISNGFKIKSNNYKTYYKNRFGKEYQEPQLKCCPVCGKVFKKYNECCSYSCARKYKLLKRISKILLLPINKQIEEIKKIYKRYCQFTFSLKDYPNEFNFKLIKENGWYKAKNHGNNLNGVSRDHKYSCNEGFKNLIDPYIISHPANCQLLIHSNNISKCDKCSISIDELINNIKDWNKKYGEYPNKIDYKLLENFNINIQIKYNK